MTLMPAPNGYSYPQDLAEQAKAYLDDPSYEDALSAAREAFAKLSSLPPSDSFGDHFVLRKEALDAYVQARTVLDRALYRAAYAAGRDQ